MQIDRSRFLMLTASIAAGGCSSNPAPVVVPEQTVVVIAPQPTAPPAPTASAVVAADPAPDIQSGRVETIARVTDEEPDEGLQGGQGLAAAPATCGNTTGRVGSCAGLRAPGPSCESFQDTQQTCTEFASGMQPRAAEKAIACLNARSGRAAICQFNVTQVCAAEALKSVCIEPFTDAPCRAAMSNCSGMRGSKLTMQQCQRALSSVKPRNRAAVLSCISEGCAADYCFYNLH
ncbi:MAG: hypothetical protein HY898_03475 [Deltaproteobacteria bacterium]|nr:hypothetical protein [Deltaproteobacteria bacterium]